MDHQIKSTFEFNPLTISNAMDEGIRDGVQAISVKFLERVQKKLSTKGTGKKYPPAKKDTKWQREGFPKYRSAAKGKPPTVQTGTLLRSWTLPVPPRAHRGKNRYVSKVKQRAVSGGMGITSPIKYGFYLETGTGNRAHPYIRGGRGALKLMHRHAQTIFDVFMRRAIIKGNKVVKGT